MKHEEIRKLKELDTGTIVAIHGDHEAFEVEFVGEDGKTIALVTLAPVETYERK